MPAQWTGQLIGEIHTNGFTIKRVVHEAGLNDKYVSQVLHSENPPEKARAKLFAALQRLIEQGEA